MLGRVRRAHGHGRRSHWDTSWSMTKDPGVRAPRMCAAKWHLHGGACVQRNEAQILHRRCPKPQRSGVEGYRSCMRCGVTRWGWRANQGSVTEVRRRGGGERRLRQCCVTGNLWNVIVRSWLLKGAHIEERSRRRNAPSGGTLGWSCSVTLNGRMASRRSRRRKRRRPGGHSQVLTNLWHLRLGQLWSAWRGREVHCHPIVL
mmetsp:Transcript_54880/g.146523  ORF Transcript_54880/g.146523 Transcript_54880/m.146523 type:complete len:202 (-) Transcript_54880:1910-2515(-)